MDRKRIIITSGLLLVTLVALILIFRDDSPEITENSQETEQNNGVGSTDPQENDSNDSDDNQTTDQILPAPVLTKSSGNNGPIPAGVLVNFTCGDVVNVECFIRLLNTETDEEILLDGQFVEAPERGQPLVLWTWESVKGTWDVTAVVSAQGFGANQSEAQELVVQ